MRHGNSIPSCSCNRRCSRAARVCREDLNQLAHKVSCAIRSWPFLDAKRYTIDVLKRQEVLPELVLELGVADALLSSCQATDNGSGGNQDERLLPFRPESSQSGPEQLVYGSKSAPRLFGVESQQLLTQGRFLRMSPSRERNALTAQLRKYRSSRTMGEFYLMTRRRPSLLNLRMRKVLATHTGYLRRGLRSPL